MMAEEDHSPYDYMAEEEDDPMGAIRDLTDDLERELEDIDPSYASISSHEKRLDEAKREIESLLNEIQRIAREAREV